MCGIFAANAAEPVAGILIEGLRRLEYRGYDSAGIAASDGGEISLAKAEGNVAQLAREVESSGINGTTGIAHTRWATHGAPTAVNAHPHRAPGIAVVHNGIVENHAALRSALQKDGAVFASETDTEVIPWLVAREMEKGASPLQALKDSAGKLEGSFAAAMLSASSPHQVFAARRGSPLMAALGPKGSFLSSDLNALAGLATEAVALDDGDVAVLTPDSLAISDAGGRPAQRRRLKVDATESSFSTGGYAHFMLKEIFEQAETAARIVDAYADPGRMALIMPIDFSRVRRLRLVACGTSYYAAAIARRWMQEHAQLETSVEIASEFRYEPLPQQFPGEVAVLISQSGETADTLAAMERLQSKGLPVIGIVNTAGSTLARKADVTLPLLAGTEVGVASTKAFTAQLMVLARLVIHAAGQRGKDQNDQSRMLADLASVPELITNALHNEPAVIEAAALFAEARNAIFLGRGEFYPLACEGALKLKETTYIHAEGFAAGELKHGPIALVDETVPVVAIAGSAALQSKLSSNIREVAARGGKIVVVGDRDAILAMSDVAVRGLTIPTAPDFVLPIVAAIPLQLLAYHVAVSRGINVDRPRNLAKSVTVE